MVFPWEPMGLNLKAMDFHGQPLKEKVSHGFHWHIIGTEANHGFPWADYGNPLCSTWMSGIFIGRH